jgi:hypothetical protein
VATSQQGEYQNHDSYRKLGNAIVKQLGSATSMSNISQTITNFEKLREIFVIWHVMNKTIVQFSKTTFQLSRLQVSSYSLKTGKITLDNSFSARNIR